MPFKSAALPVSMTDMMSPRLSGRFTPLKTGERSQDSLTPLNSGRSGRCLSECRTDWAQGASSGACRMAENVHQPVRPAEDGDGVDQVDDLGIIHADGT